MLFGSALSSTFQCLKPAGRSATKLVPDLENDRNFPPDDDAATAAGLVPTLAAADSVQGEVVASRSYALSLGGAAGVDVVVDDGGGLCTFVICADVAGGFGGCDSIAFCYVVLSLERR